MQKIQEWHAMPHNGNAQGLHTPTQPAMQMHCFCFGHGFIHHKTEQNKDIFQHLFYIKLKFNIPAQFYYRLQQPIFCCTEGQGHFGGAGKSSPPLRRPATESLAYDAGPT
jgi:hypothetical protein